MSKPSDWSSVIFPEEFLEAIEVKKHENNMIISALDDKMIHKAASKNPILKKFTKYCDDNKLYYCR